MLSKQGYVSDDAAGPWLPHVMFFVPHSPIEPTVLYIPVRRWSDGSPGPAPAELQHKM
jgi:hypothetical protein